MAKEFGPFTSAVKVVTYDPDDADQVRDVSGGSWTTIGSATFANCIKTAAQEGTTGIYFADMPASLSLTRRYIIAVYGASETNFNGSHQVYVWEPEQVVVASVTGAVGSVTGAVGSVTGAVGSVTGAVGSVTTVNDKTGYALSSAGVQAIWDALTSALTTVGSVGKWIVDKLDVVLSTRASQTSVDDLPTNAELATALAGADDATLAAIATIAGYLDTEVAAIKAKTDNLPVDPADASDISALIDALPTAAEVAAEVAASGGLTPAQDTKLTNIHTIIQSKART